MVKIGVVTLQESNNYGAVLQAYALQKTLRKLGHDPFLLPIIPCSIHRRGIKRFVGKGVNDTLIRWVELWKFVVFEQFRREYLSRGTPPNRMTASDFLANPSPAPIYITGSDQVWNPGFAPLGTPDRSVFWLNFMGNSIRRVAYAASFGVSSLSEADVKDFGQYIKQFDHVGVREQDALPLVSQLGKCGEWVCDPTLLLSIDEYSDLVRDVPPLDDMYVYEYVLHWPTQVPLPALRALIQGSRDWRVRSPFPVHLFRDVRIAAFDSPQKWVAHLTRSNFVLTNSFHGTIFSILSRRPFLTVLLSGQAAKSNGRVLSLLKRLGLEDRIVREGEEASVVSLLARDIDWDAVHERVNKWRCESLAFLRQSLA